MSQLSTWKSTVPVPGTVLFLEGNIGGPVGPDGGGIIHTIVTDGQGTAQVVGDPGTNTTGILFSVTATSNTAIGLNSLLAPGVGSINNTALGVQALEGNTTGHNNSGFGYQTLLGVTTGNNNLALGYLAGSNYTSSESNNVLLANAGVIGDTATTRIGASQTSAYIAGVYGVSPASPQMVIIDSAGQLGSQAIPATGIQTIDGDSGHASGSTITIFANTGTVNSGSSVTFVGDNVSTITFDVTDADDNTLIGRLAGNNALSGTNNVGLGFSALRAMTTATDNVAIGNNALLAVTDATNNVAVGFDTGSALTHGSNNTLVGYISGSALTTGSSNCFVGNNTAVQVTTGSRNIILGPLSGSNYATGSESDNIMIGADGVNGESNVLRIGDNGSGSFQQNKCFIAGIDGVNVGSVATVVTEASNQLGTAVLTAGSGVTITPGANTITIAATGSGGTVTTLHTQDGNNVTATAGVINLSGGNNLTTTGTAGPNTATISLTGITQHSLQVGGASNALTQLGVATNGQLPIGSAGADPVLATITAGTGISVTNGAGSITIAATGTTTLNYTLVNTSPYVVLTTDDFLGVDSSSGAIQINLPNAPATGRVWIIKDITGSAATHNITVTTVGGSVNIDGATTFVMNTNFESIDVLFNGTQYFVF